MAYQIRNKETGAILKVRSGKSIWATAGHAKAAFKTSGLGYGRSEYDKVGIKPYCYFDEQEVFEIVEVSATKDLPRFTFVQDDDCHNYMIPAEQGPSFYADLEYGVDDDYAEFNNKYEQYRINSMKNWTFVDPREDA